MFDRRRPSRRETARCRRDHAKRRALERYGAALSGRDLDRIVRAIQGGQSTPLKRQSQTRSIHKVTLHGTAFVVVYQRKTGEICTFLPPDWGGPGYVDLAVED